MHYEYYRDAEEYFRIGRTVSYGHYHRAIELVYCLRLPKPVVVDGVEMTLGEGELLFVPPFSTHIFPDVKEHSSLCVVLPVAYTDAFEQQAGGKCFESLIFRDKVLAGRIYAMLLELKNTSNPLTRSGIYSYIIGALLDGGTLVDGEKKQDNAFAVRTLTFLEKHYAEKLTLETVASELGYSRCYFSALFKKVFRAGFCDYLAMLRVRKSLRLLESCSIDEVSYAVGFGSMQNYYLNFKRVMGVTPAAYRRSKIG